MANLRKSLEGTLRRYGHNILLQRRVNGYDGNAPVFTNQLERHTTRTTSPRSQSLATEAMEGPEGVSSTSDMVYYFKYDVNPARGDRIYENIEIYPNNMETFLIDKSLPMRGRGGRIEFWVCGVTQEKPS